MDRTVSPTPSNDTLLLTSLLSTNAFSASPCTEPHMGEQQPEVSASRGTELSTKTTQFLSERQHLCLTSPDCAGTQMKRRTERLRGNCCYLHRSAQGFLNGRPKRQKASRTSSAPKWNHQCSRDKGSHWAEVERHWDTKASHTCKSRSWDLCASTWQCWKHNRSSLSAVILMPSASNFISLTSYFMSGGILFLKHF